MSTWTWLWIGWIVYFLSVEAVALKRSTKGDTLSEHIWLWFGTRRGVKPSAFTQLRRFMLVAFMAWLSLHLLTGGWV